MPLGMPSGVPILNCFFSHAIGDAIGGPNPYLDMPLGMPSGSQSFFGHAIGHAIAGPNPYLDMVPRHAIEGVPILI